MAGKRPQKRVVPGNNQAQSQDNRDRVAPSRYRETQQKRTGKRTRVIIIVIVIVAILIGILLGVRNQMRSGDGTSTVGTTDATIVNSDSTNLTAKATDALVPFGTKETSLNLAGGHVDINIEDSEDDENSVRVTLNMDDLSERWIGALIFFDSDGNEIQRESVDMPVDMGSSISQIISVKFDDKSKVAFYQLYTTDEQNQGVGVNGVDAEVTNVNEEDETGSDESPDTSNEE